MAAPARLNQEMILAEAVRLLQDEGLEQLTVRKLAARLGVEAPSLYKHFASKQQLLGRVTLHLFEAQVAQIGACRSWREWLLTFGRVLWSTQTRIRDSARLVLTTEFDRDQLDLMTKLAEEALAPHGIVRHTALEMQLSVQSLVLGLSALSEGRSARLLREMVPLDAILEESLQSLVVGWECRLRDREAGARLKRGSGPHRR